MPHRYRRLRATSVIRDFVRETHLTAHDLLQPFFVIEGKNKKEAIASMPGIYRFSVDLLLKNIEGYIRLGGRGGVLFGVSSHKDTSGKYAYASSNPVVTAIKAIKKHFPDFLIITDVCLCAYMTHGHCGIVEEKKINNDKTLPLLSKMALAHAQAGADMVAPSDMMDFRVAAIRQALNEEKFQDVGILSYAVKYSSAYYGPFREAAHSAPGFGDRKTYQMDPANSREALKEARRDVKEGADMVMVKPVLAYLDIVSNLRRELDVPIVGYNVSGEYAMIKAAAQNNWVDEKSVVLETLTSIKRAGADIIISYHPGCPQMASLTPAEKVLVGGVNSPVRAFRSVGGHPLIMDRGQGSKLFDVNGHSYTDYCLSWGALILGHAHPDIVRTVQKAVKKGVSYGTTTKPEIEIAQFIVKHVPSIDMVRFVNSGTEATMSAIRVARGFTKRNKIIKFDGCYHGHSDDLLAMAGSGVSFLSSSSSQGIPKAHIQDTLSLPFNDTLTLCHTIERHHKELACVILEPIAGNMGVINPSPDFLKSLRALTKKYEIVLIFDEVMSGFRTNLGCAQTGLGIIPDMTCLGKIIGGGFPVGAYGGRADIMKYLSPIGGVYQAGTFSGTPIVMQAGLATLKNLDPKTYKRLNTLCDEFVSKTNNLLKTANIEAHLVNYKSMISIRFQSQAVYNYKDAQRASSTKIYAKLFHHLLSQGIYWPPADLESFFVSTKHTAKDLNHLSNQITAFFLKFK